MVTRATWVGPSLLLALIVSGCAHRTDGVALPNIGMANQVVVSRWLALHPQYRLATDADCSCSEELTSIRSPSVGVGVAPNYHPYYAQGDFNRDGTVDEAYGVVHQSAPGQFSILVIDGALATKGRRADSLLEGPFKLGTALFYGPPANPEGGLLVGAFESEGCSIVPRLLGGYRLDCSEF